MLAVASGGLFWHRSKEYVLFKSQHRARNPLPRLNVGRARHNESRALKTSVSNPCESNTFKQAYKRLLITSEEHLTAAGSGAIFSSGPARYSFWSSYLEIFDEVLVLARVSYSPSQQNEQQRADGPGVSFRALPDHTGPWRYLRNRRQDQIIARRAIEESEAYLVRVPGLISQMIWREIRSKKAYAVQVLGDPWDALGPGTWPNIFRPFFRLIATRQLN